MTRQGRRRAASMGVLGLALLLTVLWPRHGSPKSRVAVVEPVPTATVDPGTPIERSPDVPAAAAPSTGAGLGFASISVEKRAVCLGEPSRIRVTPSYDGLPPGRVTSVIDGHPGFEAAFVTMTGDPGMRSVVLTLVGEGNPTRQVVATETQIEVLHCVADWPLLVDATPLPRSKDAFSVHARLLRGGEWERRTRHAAAASDDAPLEVSASRYRWSFGDETTAATTEDSIAHTFPHEADRPAELEHAYLVRVEALDDADRLMGVGYATVSLQNTHRRLELLHHSVALDAEYSQFPERDDGRKLTAKISLQNTARAETVVLDNVEVTRIGCDGHEAGRNQMAADAIFASSVLPPGGRADGRWVTDDDAKDGICYLNAVVTGVSEPGGMEASGSFSMTVGRDPLGTTVTGNERAAALTQALALLGNPRTITVDDMQRLEDEGKMPRGSLTAYLRLRSALALSMRQVATEGRNQPRTPAR